MWRLLRDKYWHCTDQFWRRIDPRTRERYARLKWAKHLRSWRQAEESPPRLPWVRFPGQTRWNQGTEAAYLTHVFYPWWIAASEQERQKLLEGQCVPEDWKERLGLKRTESP